MSITIRKVSVEETDEFVECHIKCWQAAYKGIMPDDFLNSMPSNHEKIAELFRQGINESCGYEYCCVIYNGKMIGKLGFSKCLDDDKTGAGEIHAIYLLDDYWDKGYGRQLMEFAMENLKEMGFREIVIWLLDENSRARRFYEKFGFEADGTTKEIDLSETLIEIRYVLTI